VEVNAQGQTVWEYVNPDTDRGLLSQGRTVPADAQGAANNVFKAVRYSYDDAGLSGRDLTPGAALVSGGTTAMVAASALFSSNLQLAASVS
jgi:hypothetical protein